MVILSMVALKIGLLSSYSVRTIINPLIFRSHSSIGFIINKNKIPYFNIDKSQSQLIDKTQSQSQSQSQLLDKTQPQSQSQSQLLDKH